MKAKAYLMDFWSQIRSAWQSVRMQTSGFTSIAVVAVLASVIAGIALQIQTSPRSKLENLQSHGPAHLSLTDWTAEFYTCPKDSLEGQCKRVLQKMSNGTYAVASEQLPLGSGRYVANQQFTTRPTHVKLSHKISEQDAQNITKNWSREKPVLALSGQPVCESEKCQNEDLVVPMNKLILGEKSWIQFDSQISPNGQFGPQSMPPVVVSPSKAHQIFAPKSNHQRGLFFEFGLAVLMPILAIAITIWAGKPRLYVAFSHFLTAKSLWTLTALDTLSQQPIIFSRLSLKGSFALSAFMTGWFFSSAMNFLSVAWCNKNLSRRMTTTLGSSVAIIALLTTYFSPAGSTAAVVTLRVFELSTSLTSAILLGFAYASFKKPSWNNPVANYFRNAWKPEEATRWNEQVKGLFFSFAIGATLGFWILIQARQNSYVFNWGAIALPVMLTFVLLHSRPQLTASDLQLQKNLVGQQEILVKLLSQLGTFKHRAQAISLVVNFCNRELPKLGFEPPQFLENQPEESSASEAKSFEVSIAIPVRGPHQTFGWIVAKARKRTENTAMGERIIDALSAALAQHLDTLIRSSLLESEANSAQKFVPRDLVRFFGITNLSQLDAGQEFSFNGTVVSVVLRAQNQRNRDNDALPERGIINELTALFNKGALDVGGYLATQEGLKWTLVFRDTTNSALRWIENTQVAMRSWNQHRQTLGMGMHECSFGAQISTLNLRFTENANMLRPWVQCDLLGVSATLAEVAQEYSAMVLLSQEYIAALGSGRGAGYLPESVRPLDRVWNKSKTNTIDVYEFFGGEPDIRRASKQKTVELFSQGVKLYLAGHFDGARSIMKQIVETDPNDKAAQRLLGNLATGEDLKAA